MHKPSVLFLNRVYPPARGATGRMLRDLARAFGREGWQVTVITTGPESGSQRDGAVRVVRVRGPARVGSPFMGWVVCLRMLFAGLRQPPHDLVISMTDPPLLVSTGNRIARAMKARHIHWCHDLYPDLFPVLGIQIPRPILGLLHRQSRKAMKQCERVIVIGRCMARQLTHTGIDPRRISVIPNWPDSELVEQETAAQRSVRLKSVRGARPYDSLFKDTEPKFRVLYAGNLGRAHPIRSILDAAAILATTHPEIEFVFVGDGVGVDRLAQERARRGLDNIRLLPFQPAARLREVMQSGDVHLVSMRHEAAGLLVPSKLYSALAVGRPCILIGPLHSETARILGDFKAGETVPQGQPEMLAETIRKFRMDGKMWFSAQKGAEKAGRVFLPEQSMRAWMERAGGSKGRNPGK